MKNQISKFRNVSMLFLTLIAVLGVGTGDILAQDDTTSPPDTTTAPAPDPANPEPAAGGDEPKAAEGKKEETSVDDWINEKMKPAAKAVGDVIFWKVPFNENTKVPLVLILLAGTALFLTVVFKFINLRALGTAVKTVRGKYTDPDAPGQITHFQALSAALSATVGLGNIAGVAIAIGVGGPGATLWMIILGFLGMTTKFCECTLGVKYREIDEEGKVHGGAMYYLKKGFKEIGLAPIGIILAIFFAVSCIGGAFGAGNMFQINQATQQVQNEFGLFKDSGWIFGAIIALVVGAVIIGGIKSIGRVASVIVPFMCIIYIIAAFVVVLINIDKVGSAIGVIVTYAFSPAAVGGGVVGVLIQGIQRAAFSNEAGLGSAPIAHSAVKTNRPASEGLVALLEPFVDTVIVCTMTALVIVTTGMWKVSAVTKDGQPVAMLAEAKDGAAQIGMIPGDGYIRTTGDHKIDSDGDGEPDKITHYKGFLVDTDTVDLPKGYEDKEGWIPADALEIKGGNAGGVWLTSKSFESVIEWFPNILTIAVILFCFSTMISWSYYGEQAVIYLFGHNHAVKTIYKILFCLLTVAGAAASLGNVIDLSDALIFAMVFPNLIGMYFLLPVVNRELKSYMEHVKKVDGGE